VALQGLWNADGSAPPPELAFGEALAFAWEMKGVRTPRHKLVLSIAPDTVARRGRGFLPQQPAARQLFDLRADPGETHNLLDAPADPAALAVADALERVLRSHLATAPAPVEQVELAPGTLRRLEALGYLEPAAPSAR
jgi:hypothetical protein